MLLDGIFTDVLSSLLKYKLVLINVMATDWPASSSLARGMGMLQTAPWSLSEASVAIHQLRFPSFMRLNQGKSFLRLSFGKERKNMSPCRTARRQGEQ